MTERIRAIFGLTLALGINSFVAVLLGRDNTIVAIFIVGTGLCFALVAILSVLEDILKVLKGNVK